MTSVAPARIAAIAHSPEPEARSKTRRPPTAARVVAQVPPDGEPAAPGEGPVRERRLGIVGLDLDVMPERQHIVGQMKSDRLETRDRREAACGGG